MTERLITTRQARKEEGGTLILQYFLLTEGTSAGKENFGIKIIEKESGAAAFAPGVSRDGQRVQELIIRLANGTVTPTGLVDVLADWE